MKISLDVQASGDEQITLLMTNLPSIAQSIFPLKMRKELQLVQKMQMVQFMY